MAKSDSMDDDLRCGFGGFKPSCLQVFNKAPWVVLFLSLGNCFQSMTVNGLIGVVLSTIEKRFSLASSQSSWMASAYEIGTVPALLIVSCVGARAHRPVAISLGFLAITVGCLLFFLPHFTTPLYQPGGGPGETTLCRNDTPSFCDDETGSSSSINLSRFLALFVVGRLLHGVGATPIYTLGVTYMDDTASKEKFSLYVAIFYAASVIGAAIGTIGGGFLLNLFTDFTSVDASDLGISPGDPRWVGAWWLPYVIALVVNFIIAIPIGCYPRDLPGAAEIRKSKTSEAYSRGGSSDDDDVKESVEYVRSCSELGYHLKIIFSNPTYIMLCLFISCDSLIIAGFTAFGPKYLENQFSISSSLAGALFGVILLPAGAGGTIIGGAVISRMKLSCSQILKVESVLTFLIILTGFIFFITCENLQFAGVTVPYGNTSTSFVSGLNDTCNTACNCMDIRYDPICSHDNIRYYSPCHAGCVTVVEDDIKYYYNCSCIPEGLREVREAPASSADCSATSCSTAPAFLTLFFIAVLMLFCCSSMSITATVRSIPMSQRSMAICIQWIVLRLLGTIPGPLLFGAAFDNACLLWEDNCGERGTCLYYVNSEISRYLFAVCFSIKGASLIFMVVAFICYRAPENAAVVASEASPDDSPPVEGDEKKLTAVTHASLDDVILVGACDKKSTTGDKITASAGGDGFINPAYSIDESFDRSEEMPQITKF